MKNTKTSNQKRWSVIFEFDISNDPSYPHWPWWKPGSFRSTYGNKPYRRFWWLCFAITLWQGNQKEYLQAAQNAEWKYSST